ncbi:MBL fold metallo-hydrolase [Alkalihalophilus marmarensis]|uniref:MBL fold metallo-hydrolase n=1 Tax=Alkalihalophilus marmarensis TaxID=521377 RepID=UPI002E223BD7|nr:MBL fold metallo-hydrolase [Alkalihalophilus marmarensis]
MNITVVGYWHAYPERGEATSGYLLEHGSTKLLLDCGSGVVSNVQKYIDLNDLNGVVLSHYHHDHFADIGPLQYAQIVNKGMGKRKKDFTIYAHQEDTASFNKLAYKDLVKSVAYNERAPLKIGPFTFNFFKTQHPVPCYAMKITCEGKQIVYTADSSYFAGLADFANGCDLVITECSGYSGDHVGQYGHMNSEDAAKLAVNSGIEKIILSHLPHHGDHEQLKREVEERFNGIVLLAKSGLVLEL